VPISDEKVHILTEGVFIGLSISSSVATGAGKGAAGLNGPSGYGSRRSTRRFDSLWL
jgi:hypothetical protein